MLNVAISQQELFGKMYQSSITSDVKPAQASINIDIRKRQLESLNQYITSSKDKVGSILDYLGWDMKHVLQNSEKVTCSINRNHKIFIEKLDKHTHNCYLKTAGYQQDEQFLAEPSSSNTSSIILDNAKKIEILTAARSVNPKFRPAWDGIQPDPQTSDRLHSTFSSDERLALHDYCVANTEPPPAPPELFINQNSSEDKEENLTPEEILERIRDAKRRRVKYKAVHTGRNKSYKEEMREVINNQMKLYEEHVMTEYHKRQNLMEKQLSMCSWRRSRSKEKKDVDLDYDRIARIERIEREKMKRKEHNSRDRDQSYRKGSYERARSRHSYERSYNRRSHERSHSRHESDNKRRRRH